MNESLLELGSDGQIVATVTPAAGAGPGRVIVFLNAGLIPRQGPHRNHVKWSRSLSRSGAVAVRLDMAGIGDSGAAPTGNDPSKHHLPEIRQVVDWAVRSYPGHPVFLAGTCLGAAHAWHAFINDSRVAGAFLIDPWVYYTIRTRLARIPLLAKRSRAAQVVRDLVLRMLGREPRGLGNFQAAWVELPKPDPAEMRDSILKASASGRKLKFLYTRSWSSGYRYPGQMADALGVPEVDAELWMDANHMFTDLHQQARLAAALDAWSRP